MTVLLICLSLFAAWWAGRMWERDIAETREAEKPHDRWLDI